MSKAIITSRTSLRQLPDYGQTGSVLCLTFFSRNYRHWLWIDGAMLISDDLLSYEEGVCDCLLHYEGKSQTDSALVRLTNERAFADVHLLYPSEPNVREEMGLADHEPDRRIPYLVISERQPSRVHKFVTAIVPSAAGNKSQRPDIRSVASSDTSLGVRIARNGTLTDVFLNLQADGRRMHVNSNNSLFGWETDAYLLALTRPVDREDDPHSVSRFFVSCGSYLRRSGRVYFDSLTKKNAVWSPRSSATKVRR